MTPLLTCPKSYGVPRRRFLSGLGEWRHSQGTCSEIGDELLQDMRCSSLLCLTTCTHNRVGGTVFTDPTEVNRYAWISIFSPDCETSPSTSVFLWRTSWRCGSHHSPLAVLPPLTSKWLHDLRPVLVESGSTFWVKTCMICLADTLWTIIRCHPIHSPPKHRPLQFYLR